MSRWFLLLSLFLAGCTQERPDVPQPELTPQIVRVGRAVFVRNCMSCHGRDGGPAKARWTGLEPFKRGGEAGEIYQTISHGYGAMPSFAHLPSKVRWGLSYYIRSFNPNNPEHKYAR